MRTITTAVNINWVPCYARPFPVLTWPSQHTHNTDTITSPTLQIRGPRHRGVNLTWVGGGRAQRSGSNDLIITAFPLLLLLLCLSQGGDLRAGKPYRKSKPPRAERERPAWKGPDRSHEYVSKTQRDNAAKNWQSGFAWFMVQKRLCLFFLIEENCCSQYQEIWRENRRTRRFWEQSPWMTRWECRQSVQFGAE